MSSTTRPLWGRAGDDHASDFFALASTRIAPGAIQSVVAASAGDDVILGADDVSAGDGADVVSGRGGDDVLRGETGEDVVDGGSGRDVVLGGTGRDVLSGGAGDDRMAGSERADVVNGDVGDDTSPRCSTPIHNP